MSVSDTLDASRTTLSASRHDRSLCIGCRRLVAAIHDVRQFLRVEELLQQHRAMGKHLVRTLQGVGGSDRHQLIAV